MEIRMTKQLAVWMLGASVLALAACGGSSEPTEDTHAETPPAVESAADMADDAAGTVEEALADTADAAADLADDAVEGVEDAAADAGDMVEGALEDAGDALSDAADEVEETIEDAMDAAGDMVEAVTMEPTDKVSAESIAAYAALTGDADAGRRVFTKCMSCHVIAEGQNRVGPSLYGVVGREAGGVDGFRYSDVNANSHVVWTEEALFVYLENPQAFLPGTTMAFPGLPRPQERADVIAYIKRESGQ